MQGFVNKLFISVQLIVFLNHVLLLAELAQKFKLLQNSCMAKWFHETELQGIYLYISWASCLKKIDSKPKTSLFAPSNEKCTCRLMLENEKVQWSLFEFASYDKKNSVPLKFQSLTSLLFWKTTKGQLISEWNFDV